MDDKLIPTLVLPGDEEEAQQAAAEAEAPVQEAAQPVQAAAAAVQTAPVEEAQQAPAQEEKKDEPLTPVDAQDDSLNFDNLSPEEQAAVLAKAQQTADPADAQIANDFSQLIERFEKRIHDLKLTRMVSVQMGPQIRLMQNNDNVLAERIQSTIANTIPLWKSQMVIAMGMQHAESALNAQKAVTDMTNELLRSNAERLKVGTIETAKEAERGVVDIETIRTANTALIDTLNEVQKIQREGAQKRAAAAIELGRLEKELRDKVLEINH